MMRDYRLHNISELSDGGAKYAQYAVNVFTKLAISAEGVSVTMPCKRLM